MHLRTFAAGILCAVCGFAVSAAGSAPPDAWNIEAQVQPLLENLYSGEPGRIAFVGDSISFRKDTWIWDLRDRLDNRFGNAGEGYLSCAGGFVFPGTGNGPRSGLEISEVDHSPSNTGASNGDVYWATVNGPRDPVRGALAPDGMYAVISNTGRLVLKIYGSRATIYYIAGPDGGSLRLLLNGSNPVELPAFAPTPTLRAHTIETGAPDNDTLSELSFESVSGEPIQINGILMEGPGGGSQELRISRGGVGPADFLVSATGPVADQLASLKPDLCIVMIDWEFSYYQPSNPLNNEKFWFDRDTRLLMDFYEQAMPDTRFILASHHPFNTMIAEEAETLYRIAVERGHGFLNLYTTWPNVGAMWTAGLMADPIHLSPLGGRWFGGYYFDTIFAHTCGPDVNNDGAIDVDDLNALLSHWQRGGDGWGDGDVNFDRMVDVDDLNEILGSWGCTEESVTAR